MSTFIFETTFIAHLRGMLFCAKKEPVNVTFLLLIRLLNKYL